MKKFLQFIKKYFVDFGVAVGKGDVWTKLSLLIMGIGYAARGQVVKGILMTLIEIGFFLFTAQFSWQYIAKLNTLGTVETHTEGNGLVSKTIVGDNSLMILLCGIIGIMFILAFILLYISNMKAVYRLQQMKKNGEHINSFKEDCREMVNGKFYITLLTLPSLGVLLINVLPIIFMVCIAFTNYDAAHQPPSNLFTWVGLKNFKALFSMNQSNGFGYAFIRILIWTLIWALLATFTTYILGILLAKFINNEHTKCKKMWRSLFVVTIAIPQFVTLLLVSKMFSNYGIVNGICSKIGLTGFLQSIGLVSKSLTYIPFLTKPGWAHVMIVLINIWVGVPYQMLIATGILMNIPTDQLESAKIDGATNFQIFWKITMPYMLFVTGPSLITSFIGNINNFNVIYLLTGDYTTTNSSFAAADASEVDLLVTWLFNLTSESTTKRYYMASVIGIIIFIICAVLTLISFRKMTSGDKEEVYQ
jgi:arabinogalactan oligomer/maltooligosaccharide transport system permease protein